MNASHRILILYGHPDPEQARFGHALAAAYETGALGAGHTCRRLDLAHLDFPLLRTRTEWEDEPPVPDIAAAIDAIAWCDHLVFIFPLWLGTMPALVKGFLEQVMRPHVGAGRDQDRTPGTRLAGKSARIVVTAGMPAWWYWLAHGALGVRGLERSILRFSGAHPVRTTTIGSVEGSASHRARALDRLKRLGARAG